MASLPRTWIELSAAKLRRNYVALCGLAGAAAVLPIVKANAYGHGLAELWPVLAALQPYGLGVAYGDEAILLRRLGFRGRIVVLSFWHPDQLVQLIGQRAELVVWDWCSWRAVNDVSSRGSTTARVHLKLDSGTSRIGFLPSDRPKLRRAIARSKVKIVGVFSHLANAEERNSTRTKDQIQRFTTLEKKLGIDSGVVRHLACTAAVIRYPEAHFRLLRPGIGLYGFWPSAEIQAWSTANRPYLNLQPVLSWYTRLTQVKTLAAGTSVGYGATVTVKRPTVIGVMPVGYADGYDRRLSNRGWVIIRGRRAPILGRVCMNLTMVDLSRCRDARVGDKVTLIGTDISVDEMAAAAGAINYEIATRINWAIPRRLSA